MATPLHKRRRLDDALHKPFRSPLKRHAQPDTYEPKAVVDSAAVDMDAEHSSTMSVAPLSSVSATPPIQNNAVVHTTHMPRSAPPSQLTSPRRSFETSAATTSGPLDPTTIDLESQIHSLRMEIDDLQSAHRLLSTSRQSELKGLTLKWKYAARVVIEELFGSAKDRVNRMGGVGAWREQESQRRERRRKWEMQDMEEAMKKQEREIETDDDEDDGEEEEEEEEGDHERGEGGNADWPSRRERRDRAWEARRALRELRKQQREERDVVERLPVEEEEPHRALNDEGNEGRDDDAFTIGMMLRTLNIDFELVGYDNNEQRWMD